MNELRIISDEEIYTELYRGIRKMNVVLAPDIVDALGRARKKDSDSTNTTVFRNDKKGFPGASCFVFDSILENAELAEKNSIPMCQDTGFVLVFVEIGHQVHISGEPLDIVIHRAVKNAYIDGLFRKSVVEDPLRTRKNTGTNLPPAIYYDFVPGNTVKISCLSKGFGSENYSRTFMLKPTQGPKDIIEKVVLTMNDAGGNCCPPVILGIGIGGTMDWAAKISKKALLRELNDSHPDPYYRELENKILFAVNDLGIGAGGLGGGTTALGVHIETYPTHIAGLPLAISVNCWAERKVVLSW